MTSKEYVLSEYENAVVVKIDGYYYVDLNDDENIYLPSESETKASAWVYAKAGLVAGRIKARKILEERKRLRNEFACSRRLRGY